MLVTNQNKKYLLQAMQVDFLTEKWERDWYALALMRADAWGRGIDKKKKEYKAKNSLTAKYNH